MNYCINEIKCMVFDVDDTLLFTFKNGYHKVNYAARKMNRKEISLETFRKLYGFYNFEECIERWFLGVDVEIFKAYYNQAINLYQYKAICNFGHLQQKLHKKGIKTAILTNGKNDEKLQKKMKIAQVDIEKISCIYTRENSGEVKPSGEGLLRIAKELKISTNNIIYVGDMKVDLFAAKDAGTRFIGVRTGGYIWPNEVEFLIVNHVGEIKSML